jgi:hypothetical protein
MVTKTTIADRLALWLSTSRYIDGLWVGSIASERELGLRRVEDALGLIKRYDTLHYSRITDNLERIWVNIVADGDASYHRRLKACVLDERFVSSDTTTLQQIAAVIVHEATHARIERCGISYDEKLRPRIEAVCLRRELAFVGKLPNCAELRDGLVRTMERCVVNPDYFSTARFHERELQGQIEALRYLGTPDWIVQRMLRLRQATFALANLLRQRYRRFLVIAGLRPGNPC